MSGGYVINVGNAKPAKAIVGQYDEKTGVPKGDTFERFISVGAHMMMNQARVWGVRTIGGKIPSEPVEVTDTKYKGELEFLEWGNDKGYAIEIRYVPQSRSLDAEYQDVVQKLKIDKEKGIESIFPQLKLSSGQNKFDNQKQALLIKFLKVHPGNRESRSKNPDPEIKGHQFYEVTDDMVDKISIESRESNIEAGVIIKELANDASGLRNIFEILGDRPEFQGTTLLDKDREIYKVLLRFTETNASDFFYLIKEFKKEVSDNFEKLKSYDAIDLTKNGFVVIQIEGKPIMLWDDAEGKGDEMILWALENYYTEKVYDKLKLVKQLITKLK